MKVVPLPSWLSKATVPPSDLVMRLTTAKPNPCPLDFVVNKGVNSLSFASLGMPTPVSATVMTESFASLKASMESIPPSGILEPRLLRETFALYKGGGSPFEH